MRSFPWIALVIYDQKHKLSFTAPVSPICLWFRSTPSMRPACEEVRPRDTAPIVSRTHVALRMGFPEAASRATAQTSTSVTTGLPRTMGPRPSPPPPRPRYSAAAARLMSRVHPKTAQLVTRCDSARQPDVREKLTESVSPGWPVSRDCNPGIPVKFQSRDTGMTLKLGGGGRD